MHKTQNKHRVLCITVDTAPSRYFAFVYYVDVNSRQACLMNVYAETICYTWCTQAPLLLVYTYLVNNPI